LLQFIYFTYNQASDVVVKAGLGLKTGFKTIVLRSWSGQGGLDLGLGRS